MASRRDLGHENRTCGPDVGGVDTGQWTRSKFLCIDVSTYELLSNEQMDFAQTIPKYHKFKVFDWIG